MQRPMSITLRLANPKLTQASYDAASAAWARHRDAGFRPGCCDELACQCDLNYLPLGTLLHRSDNTAEVAVYQTRNGAIVAVGDIEGPWAVTISLDLPPPVFAPYEHVYISRPNGPDGEAVVSRITDDVIWVRFDREFPVAAEHVRRIVA
jgi:hypothetical protein